MANKIGRVSINVMDLQYTVNVPKLLTVMATSEVQQQNLKAILITSDRLQDISERAIELQDPVLIEILSSMKLIKLQDEFGGM